MGIVSWISHDGRWVELDLPRGLRAEFAETGRVAWYGDAEPVRADHETSARRIEQERMFLEARQRAIAERKDELVSRRPALKALPRQA